MVVAHVYYSLRDPFCICSTVIFVQLPRHTLSNQPLKKSHANKLVFEKGPVEGCAAPPPPEYERQGQMPGESVETKHRAIGL
ncbi:hypothetical protein N431DRAFT_178917 [Stipitochalara longipes BDJ]|nr:hypothetical protein N431DRAFT_178917 [Stipitochalara longipes BDJ]